MRLEYTDYSVRSLLDREAKRRGVIIVDIMEMGQLEVSNGKVKLLQGSVMPSELFIKNLLQTLKAEKPGLVSMVLMNSHGEYLIDRYDEPKPPAVMY